MPAQRNPKPPPPQSSLPGCSSQFHSLEGLRARREVGRVGVPEGMGRGLLSAEWCCRLRLS